jgi:hypothetical protein
MDAVVISSLTDVVTLTTVVIVTLIPDTSEVIFASCLVGSCGAFSDSVDIISELEDMSTCLHGIRWFSEWVPLAWWSIEASFFVGLDLLAFSNNVSRLIEHAKVGAYFFFFG